MCCCSQADFFHEIFFLFRSLMTIIELNNCPLFLSRFDFPSTFFPSHSTRNPLALTQTTHPTHNYYIFPSDQILELTLRLAALPICNMYVLFYLKRARGFLFYYTIFAPPQPEQTALRCVPRVDLCFFLLLHFLLVTC